MKKNMRKFLAILMALTLIASVIAMPAFAHGPKQPGRDEETTSEYPTNADGSTDTSGMTQEQIDAINAEHAEDKIYHIDVRIDGEITLQTATDGEITDEQTVDLVITSQPDATYTNGDTTIDVSLQQNATPDENVGGSQYEYMESPSTRQQDKYDYGGTVNLVADVTYTNADGKVVETVLEYDEVMTYVDNACGKKDANDSQLGYDVVINATQLTEIITEKTTVTLTKTWDTSGDDTAVIPDTITLTNNSTIENADGEVIHKEVTLSKSENANEDGSWTYTITDVSKDEDISIESESIDGYTSSKVTNDSGEEETRLNKNDGTGYWLVNIFNGGKNILNKWFGTPKETEPEVTEPEVTEPEVTEPEVTEPEVTEPEVTEPEATEPEVTEPEVTEPEVTEPEVTEPEVTEPEVTEPETTEPEVTEPEVTEPEVTEPETTEPEATEPPAANPPAGNDPAPVNYPVAPLAGDGLVEIEDEDVPLADVPQTGDISMIFAAVSALSAGGLLVLNRKRKDEE